MKQFICEVKNYGLKVALGNQLILFMSWFVNAKSFKITYNK